MRPRTFPCGSLRGTPGDLQLLFFGLVAALSPMAFAATLAVIQAGRLKALGFMVALVASQFLVCAVLVLVGGWTVPDREVGHPTLRGWLVLAFGVWMLWLAALVRRRPQPEPAQPRANSRAASALERLTRVRAGTALVAGLVLGVGGPKRLVLTALASGSIAATTSSTVEKTVLVGSYTILATLFVWAPIVAFELAGERAMALIRGTARWVSRRRRRAKLVTFLVLGIAAVADAAALLL